MTKIDIISGFLGAGKTTFTKGLARGLDIDQEIITGRISERKACID